MSISYRDRVGLSVSRTTNRLFALGSIPPTTNRSPNLSIEECTTKVWHYYREIGGTFPLVLDEAYVDESNSPTDLPEQTVHVFLDYVAPGTNYRFRAGIEAIVDRTYGTPENMQIAERPSFVMPHSVVSKEQATASAVAAVDLYTRWNVFEAASQDAKFDVPGYVGMPHRATVRHRSLARTGTACLVYEVTVHNASFQAGNGRPFCQVYVDAETGEPIAIYPAYERNGGRATLPRKLSLGDGEWKVGLTRGRIVPCEKSAPFASKQVLARRGKVWAALHFDAKSKLVWMISGGRVQVGRPDAPLVAALREANSIPSYKMEPKARP